jgi:phosphonate transport system substrate-binding protein
MKKRQFLKSSAAVLLYPLSFTATAKADKPISIAIFPRRNASITYSMFMPLASYLGDRLGRTVKLEIFKDFGHFWSEFKNNQYDIVHFNPYHYLLAKRDFGYQVFARNVEFSAPTIAGVITVRKDENIDTLEQLRGKNILFGGGPKAMLSYIAPVWLLQNAGLYPGDYNTRFAINPPNALISTYLRRADAAGTGDVVMRLDVVKKIVDVSKMKFLARTDRLAHLPWALHPRNKDMIDELRYLFTSMNESPEGQSVLDNMVVSNFAGALEEDYEPHRKIVVDVFGDSMEQQDKEILQR